MSLETDKNVMPAPLTNKIDDEQDKAIIYPLAEETNKSIKSGRRSERRESSSNKRMTIKDQIMAKKNDGSDKASRLNSAYFEPQEPVIVLKVRELATSTPFSIVMSAITIYALFADDVRVIAFGKDADPVFWALSCVCLAAFSFEIILCSISQKGYFLGFYFWLDLLSTISLILDIGWISESIFGTSGSGSASSVAALAKASRASRVGTRAGRIVRVVRLIRLVRLYKHAQQAFQKQAKKFEEEQRKLREEQARQNAENIDSEASSEHMNQAPDNMMLHQLTPGMHPIEAGQQPGHFDLEQRNVPLLSAENKAKDTLSQKKGKSLTSLKELDDQEKSLPNNESRGNEHDRSIVQVPRERDRQSVASSYKKSSSLKSSKTFNSTDQEMLMNQETKVGKILTEAVTKTAIIIVLCIMFSLPIFSIDTYTQTDTAFGTLELIYKWKNVNNALFTGAINSYVSFLRDQKTPLIFLEIDDVVYFPTSNDSVLYYAGERNDDLSYETYNDANGNVLVTSIASSINNNKTDGVLSIVRTIFVSVVLTVASMKFSGDIEQFVVGPIEKMLEKVKRISSNPLEAAMMEEKEEFAMEQLREEGKDEELQKIQETAGYETVVLEKLIIRVGALLALGFGEAGSEIIASNMKKGGVVDPMIPGAKIMAIFGFCDIRNFTDATEVLQTGVMVFVNEIAQITHGTVDAYLGQANKNIGDAFLLVWKFREQDYLRHSDGSIEFLKNDITSNFADLSVISFLKVMAGITLSNNLKKYKQHAGLQARMKGYRVKMGFGLHFGWAIEGAIGSDFKIDASYLSPNVNMASRLEAATKQFGTGLLISGQLRDILTDKCQQQLRRIDRVTVKGSIEPIDLYTADVDLDRLYQKRKGKDVFDVSNFSREQIKKKKIVDKMTRNNLRTDIAKGTKRIATQFDTDPDLKEMRKEFTKEFMDTWKKGMDLYIEGKWLDAVAHLKRTSQWFSNRQDGPSETLLEVMKETKFVAPKGWQGYRALTEK